MLNKCNEEDFNQIKSAALDRLSPNNVSGFSWGFFAFGVIMTVLSFAGLFPEDHDSSLFMSLMVSLNLLILIIQFILTVLFTSKKLAYKFQKFHSVFLCFIAFKISIDTYQFFFGASERFGSPNYLKNSGLLLLLGGIIFMVISTFRVIKRVEKGELRKSGKGLYDFQNSKGFVSVPIIFGITILGGVGGRFFSEVSNDITAIIALVLGVVIQYSIAMAIPEFFLLAYCKFRFESFKVKRPEGRMRGSKR